MAWSYSPLWITLIKKGIKKSQLVELCGLNSSTIAKMGKGEVVSMSVVGRLCDFLECSVSDIVEYIPDGETGQK